MAAETSSVSYRTKMPEEALVAILASCEIPSAYIAHVIHLLDEAPAQILVMAAEQAALQTGRPHGGHLDEYFKSDEDNGQLAARQLEDSPLRQT
jgi:hypothetical protein